MIERATDATGWLAGERTPEMVGDVLEALFVDRLPTCTRRDELADAAAGELGFTPSQRCILQVLDELREALERDDGGGAGWANGPPGPGAARVGHREPFARNDATRIPGNCCLLCTGDLHGANVLVSTGRIHGLNDLPEPFRRHPLGHRPGVAAVDLLMHSVDAGTIPSLHGFQHLADARARSAAGEPNLTAVTTTPGTSAAPPGCPGSPPT